MSVYVICRRQPPRGYGLFGFDTPRQRQIKLRAASSLG
jgi:hypothetical protein